MRLMDFSTTVAAEYSHRIDFSVWLDRCNMQHHSFRYRVLLPIARLLILLHFAVLEFSVIHCILKYNEVASSFKNTFRKAGLIWNTALSKWKLLLINRYYNTYNLSCTLKIISNDRGTSLQAYLVPKTTAVKLDGLHSLALHFTVQFLIHKIWFE